MTKHSVNNISLTNISRWILTGILVLLPFQRMISESMKLWGQQLSGYAGFINYVDEVAIIVFLPFAAVELFRRWKDLHNIYIILLFPVMFFSVCGFMSGIINGNPIFITAAGVFDYIKYYFVIFIFIPFFRDQEDFKKLFRILLTVAVSIGILALIQECWALASRYLLGKDIEDMSTYFLNSLPLAVHRDEILDHWRFGIYRAPSLLRNPNLVGLYSVFFLTIYMFLKKRPRATVVGMLLSGLFFSISRRIYMCFAVLLGLIFARNNKKRGIVLILCVLLLLFSASTFFGISGADIMKKIMTVDFLMISKEVSIGGNVISYREYTKNKAMEIWGDHPMMGVGPGMFGGKISIRMHKSPVYEEYNFIAHDKLTRWEGIDYFWPQVQAETGIIGTLAYAGIFYGLFVLLFFLKKEAALKEVGDLLEGLAAFTIIIVIYSLGGIFSLTSVMFTFMAFVGIGISCVSRQ